MNSLTEIVFIKLLQYLGNKLLFPSQKHNYTKQTNQTDDDEHQLRIVRSEDAVGALKKSEAEGFVAAHDLSPGLTQSYTADGQSTRLYVRASGCLKQTGEENLLEFNGKDACTKLITLKTDPQNTSGTCSLNFTDVNGSQVHQASVPITLRQRVSSATSLGAVGGGSQETFVKTISDFGSKSMLDQAYPVPPRDTRYDSYGSEDFAEGPQDADYLRVLSDRSLLFIIKRLLPDQCYCLVTNLGFDTADIQHNVPGISPNKTQGYHHLLTQWKNSKMDQNLKDVFEKLLTELTRLDRVDIVMNLRRALREGKELPDVWGQP